MTQSLTTVQNLDPKTLLTDVNVRTDLRMTDEFVASIRDHGVLMPIVAVTTADGVRVRMGHRRTRAAVEAGLATVPVIVTDEAHEGSTAEIDRLLTQHAENHHRASLTEGENVAVATQLSLLGLTAAQIAKRTHTKRDRVDAALKIGKSALAAKATDRYTLTLDQAVVVAEFDNDTETAKALIVAATEGKFEHVAERARRERAEAEAQAPLRTLLAEQGVPVLDRAPRYNEDAEDLTNLVDPDGERLAGTDHTGCPGHAVYLEDREIYRWNGIEVENDRWSGIQWPEGSEPADDDEAEARMADVTVEQVWEAVDACTAPADYGHFTRNQWYERSRRPVPASEKTPAEREADRVARRLVIDNNKAWKDARTVRRAAVKTFLSMKKLPDAAGSFMAAAMTSRAHLLGGHDADRIAAEWLGAEPATYGRSTDLALLVEGATHTRGLVITLAVILAGFEHAAGDNAWRANGATSDTGHYLRFLRDALGYVLSDVEEYAASDQTV